MQNNELPSYVAPEPVEAGMIPASMARKAFMAMLRKGSRYSKEAKEAAMKALKKLNLTADEFVSVPDKVEPALEEAAGATKKSIYSVREEMRKKAAEESLKPQYKK